MPVLALFQVQPVASTATSALTYVPAVLLSRGLAFLRTLVVAWILARLAAREGGGDEGRVAFGAYQTALEFVNLFVPLLMLGAGDVVERYLGRIEREGGAGAALAFVRRQLGRLLLRGTGVAAVLLLAAPWVARWVWGEANLRLLGASVATVVALAVYQYVASLLRAVRAYGAAAGLEATSAVLLLLLSAGAAFARTPELLMWAYAASVVLPLGLYVPLVLGHLHAARGKGEGAVAGEGGATLPRTGAYAAWTLVRLLLVMAFGFLSIWGVRQVVPGGAGGAAAMTEAANFALPYRIAQLLGFVGVTLWSSVFAIAARAWSHGQRRRAVVQFFRVGRIGAAVLVGVALVLLVGRSAVAVVLPAAYGEAIVQLLPGMLALFVWYALLSLAAAYGDLREMPWKGAVLWGVAVGLQVAGIAAAHLGWLGVGDAKAYMLHVSAGALAAPLLGVAPVLLCRPLRMTATGLPVALLALAPMALMAPHWVVSYLAPPVLLGVLLFLAAANVLVRRADQRASRRWRRKRARA
jgi:hypothetical protein